MGMVPFVDTGAWNCCLKDDFADFAGQAGEPSGEA